MEPTSEDPTSSDAALIAACRAVQESALAAEELAARWQALERGWRAHIERHERYAQSRLLRHDREAAARVLDRHLQIATRFHRCAVDLNLRIACADVAAKMMLDQALEHLTAEGACRFVAPPRRRRRAVH